MHSPTSRDDLLRRRYGSHDQPQGIIWNEQVEHLIGHRSQRAFLPDPVTDAQVATIVAAAQSASSSSNQHLWSVIAVTDNDTKAKLAEFTQGPSMGGKGYDFVGQAPMVLLWVADMSRNQAISTAAGAEADFVDYLDAFLMAGVDTSLAAQNGLVAAQSIGLGGVYLGSMRNRSRELADLMGLPNYAYVVFGMAIGTPDPDQIGSMRPRPPQHVVLHHERYDADQTTEWIDDYEAAFREFRTEAGLREKTWADAVATASGLSYMDGREDLRATVQDRGYRMQ
ncbi:nitroreductase family protein [Promicromonospora sukumoe]|uniref:nitroreductase family protein n=1 Tax=Promicromonospora sukumoe TaxID=88382 RepID=UPI0037C6E4D7